MTFNMENRFRAVAIPGSVGICRYTMVVLWGIVVPHIAHASFCDTVDCEAARACVTTTDPFSIMEKSDESQFFENMTIYLKTKKMSQWTKQMRWRIKK